MEIEENDEDEDEENDLFYETNDKIKFGDPGKEKGQILKEIKEKNQEIEENGGEDEEFLDWENLQMNKATGFSKKFSKTQENFNLFTTKAKLAKNSEKNKISLQQFFTDAKKHKESLISLKNQKLLRKNQIKSFLEENEQKITQEKEKMQKLAEQFHFLKEKNEFVKLIISAVSGNFDEIQEIQLKIYEKFNFYLSEKHQKNFDFEKIRKEAATVQEPDESDWSDDEWVFFDQKRKTERKLFPAHPAQQKRKETNLLASTAPVFPVFLENERESEYFLNIFEENDGDPLQSRSLAHLQFKQLVLDLIPYFERINQLLLENLPPISVCFSFFFIFFEFFLIFFELPKIRK